mmetsp:Transcript_37130/g.116733  ORF Transcript_37130/g.116733 Transcript_37130/m.116733 type:complete len:284 (+) Transcript_37130:1070-1921(+)
MPRVEEDLGWVQLLFALELGARVSRRKHQTARKGGGVDAALPPGADPVRHADQLRAEQVRVLARGALVRVGQVADGGRDCEPLLRLLALGRLIDLRRLRDAAPRHHRRDKGILGGAAAGRTQAAQHRHRRDDPEEARAVQHRDVPLAARREEVARLVDRVPGREVDNLLGWGHDAADGHVPAHHPQRGVRRFVVPPDRSLGRQRLKRHVLGRQPAGQAAHDVALRQEPHHARGARILDDQGRLAVVGELLRSHHDRRVSSDKLDCTAPLGREEVTHRQYGPCA